MFDVEEEHLVGPGSRLVQHAPQQPLPEVVLGPGEEGLELVGGDGPGPPGLASAHALTPSLEPRSR